MFSIKFFHFVKGYVILKLSGKNKEVSLEKLRKSGVAPMDVSYSGDAIEMRLSYHDYCCIKDKKNKFNFTVVKEEGGIFFLKKVLSRRVLLAGILMSVVAVIASSGYIWTVEFTGVSTENLPMVKKAAEQSGIKIGANKRKLLSPLELKNTILANADDIAWCWVYIKGTKAIVDVRESYLPPEVFDINKPCHIVAAKDGIIRKITAKRGTFAVSENTAVSRGDVLISGEVTYGDGEGYYVHASGDALAATSYQRQGVYKLYQNHKIYTGKRRNFLSLKAFSFKLPLYFKFDTDFAYYDREEKNYEISFPGENYLGVGLEKVSLIEYNIVKEPISEASCAEFAKKELEAEISKELLPGSVLEKSEIKVDKIDEETISVTLMMEFTENIAAEKYIEEVKIFEPKTD